MADDRQWTVSVASRISQIVAGVPDVDINASLLMTMNRLQYQINQLNARLDENLTNELGNYDEFGVAGNEIAIQNYVPMKNNSGGALDFGSVVVLDTSQSQSVKTTTSASDETVFGTVASDESLTGIVNGDQVKINVHGRGYAYVNADVAAISIGDYLVTHTVAKYAKKESSPYAKGIFAVAMEAKGSGTGIIQVYVLGNINTQNYERLDGSNQPATGNKNIFKENPESRLTDSIRSEYARKIRIDTSNKASQHNRTLATGRFGKTVVANSNTDRIIIPYNAGYNVGSGDFSISKWVRRDNVGVTGAIFSNRLLVSDAKGWIVLMSASNQIWAIVDAGAVASNLLSTGTITDNDEHLIVITFDRDGNCNFYIDNVLSGTTDMSAAAGNLDIAQDPMIFYSTRNNKSMLGSVDELAIFNKVLDASEIEREWNTGSGYYHSGTEDGIILLMHFDEGVGGTTREEIVGQDATLSSVTWDTGKVVVPGSMTEVAIWECYDGADPFESAIIKFGDPSSRCVIRGKTIRFEIGGVEEAWIDANGNWDLGDSNLTTTGNIFCTNLTATGDGTFDEITITNATQNFLITGSTNRLAIQGQSSGSATVVSLFSADGDGTDAVGNYWYATGLPNIFGTTWERLFIGFSGNRYLFDASSGSAGSDFPLVFSSGIDNQFRLEVDGTCRFGSDNKVYFGAEQDAYVEYDGNNFNCNPKAVGSGAFKVLGAISATGYTVNVNARVGVYTATALDDVITGSGTFTVNLPAIATITGKIYYIKNIGTGTITVDGDGAENIDGVAIQTLATQYDSLMIVAGVSEWHII